MTYSFWASIAETPWWIWAAFVYLIWAGITATSARIVSMKSLFMIPVIFLLLSFIAMVTQLQINSFNLFAWIACMLIGLPLGWLQCRALKIQALKNQRALYIPGTYSLLIMLVVLAIVKYSTGFELSIGFKLLQPHYSPLLMAIYGFGIGLFAGRIFYALRCLQKGPFYVASTMAS